MSPQALVAAQAKTRCPLDMRNTLSVHRRSDAAHGAERKPGVVGKGLAASEWARCRNYIQEALERSPGLETIEDIEQGIRECRLQFWPGRASAVITEIGQYPRKRVLIVNHAGGDLNELIEMEPSIAAFARGAGCDLVMGFGRMGWKRIWEKRGYRLGWVAMIRNLKQ